MRAEARPLRKPATAMIAGTAWWTTLMVSAPLLAAAVTTFAGMRSHVAARVTALASATSVVAAALLLASGPRGVVILAEPFPELFFTLSWRLDTAPLALAVLVAAIGTIVLHSCGYLLAGKVPGGGRIIAQLAVFETAMLGLVMADNLLLLFVFWELTGLCSFFLIRSDRSKGEKGRRAADHAFLVTVAGGLSLLVAIIYLVQETGTASLEAMSAAPIDAGVRTLALALVLPAVFTKSAQFPTHFWLPGAMAAPTPVSAYLHSATMVKAGVILLLYLYPVLGGTALWSWGLLTAGSLTCIWGSVRALGEPDIKLLMAWSTVSQLGVLTVTIGLGTDVAIRAAVLHLFAHAVFKAGLFLVVGGVDLSTGTRSLPELGGLARRAPVLTSAAAVLAGSMAGIPPLAGFLSKELILKKAMLADLGFHTIAVGTLILASIGTVAYSSRFFFEVFTDKPRSRHSRDAARLPAGLLFGPTVLAIVTLAAGPGAGWIDRFFLEPVAMAIVRAPLEVKPLSLWYGINTTLIVSIVIVTTGTFVDRLLGLRFVPPPPSALGSWAQHFDAFMLFCRSAGSVIVRRLASPQPRFLFALSVGIAAIPGLLLIPGFARLREAPISITGVLTVVALTAILAAILRARRRLPRVLLMTASGFCVALIFRLSHGPDLMLTQLLVEVSVTVFFAMALCALPSQTKKLTTGPGGFRPIRVAAAALAGVSAAALVPAMMSAGGSGHVAEFVRTAAPEIAQGANLVNVVLTDVRALDTLLETLVVVLAVLGVVGLVHGRETADPQMSASGCRQIGGLLPEMATLVLPFGLLFAGGLLLKGHNAPGGGFVAGLSLGVCLLLGIVALGPSRVHRWLPGSLAGISIGGALLMLAVSALGPLAASRPALTQLHAKVELAGLVIPLHSTLLFDLGVMLAVGGGLGVAGLAMWSAAGGRELET